MLESSRPDPIDLLLRSSVIAWLSCHDPASNILDSHQRHELCQFAQPATAHTLLGPPTL